MNVDDYIKVEDITTNAILMQGKISIITDNPAGYSVNGLFFVNPYSSKIKITKFNHPVEQLCNTVCESDKYILYKHNNIDNTFDYDFFMWDAIEPEVKDIVDLLNQIPGIETYSSCSGHGKTPPYVDFYVKDWDNFNNLLDFLRENQQSSKSFKHNDIESKHRFIIGVEGKNTVHLESLEINSNFKELCRFLKKYMLL